MFGIEAFAQALKNEATRFQIMTMGLLKAKAFRFGVTQADLLRRSDSSEDEVRVAIRAFVARQTVDLKLSPFEEAEMLKEAHRGAGIPG